MLNAIEKFKVAILHLNRDWNDCVGLNITLPFSEWLFFKGNFMLSAIF